jgi:hypothetical protein
MVAICFYFQVYQYFRIKKYNFFYIRKNIYYFDDESMMKLLILV